MNQMNMLGYPAVNSFQYQIRENEPVKMVDDYPEELDLWLEEHIADVEEQGAIPVTAPTQAMHSTVGSFILQHGSQGGFSLQQGTTGGMVLQQGPLLLQQGGGQQVFLQQQSGLVVQVPQQAVAAQQQNQPPRQVQQVQRAQQPVQQIQQVQQLVQPTNHVQSTQQVHLGVQATQQVKLQVQQSQQVHQNQQVQHLVQQVQKVVQPQTNQVVNRAVLKDGEGRLPGVEEVVKPKIPEGKVVVYNEMPDVPNAIKGPDGKYPCDQCEYKATRQWNLKKHKLSVHEGVKYGCDECDYKATDQSQVKKHKRGKHGNEIKNIQC